MNRVFVVLAVLGLVSMAGALTANMCYGTDRMPPRWIDAWFFGSAIALVWAVLIPYAAIRLWAMVK